jgi:spectinomycin phosphotransferase
MLQKPDLDDKLIVRALQGAYGLPVARLSFLPIGADVNTVVYRAVTADGTHYFVKLRRGAFDPITVEVPTFLHALGITEVMAPLATTTGELCVNLRDYKLMLYPFVEGFSGYDCDLSDAQWRALGKAIRAVHDSHLPDELLRRIPHEAYSPLARNTVKAFMTYPDTRVKHDVAAVRLVEIMEERRVVIQHVVSRAEQLAASLVQQPRMNVLCHTDIHAGNVHLCANESLYIVDWDNPLLAPRERDLMYIGAWGAWSEPRNVQLFYEGYGATQLNQTALAYYRYEHFIQDLYEWCKMLFLTPEGCEDREQAIEYLEGCFDSNGEASIACHTEAEWLLL